LFGGDDHAEPSLRLAPCEPWSRGEQMAKERENFGFYFAAHPVEQYRAIASANGARSYASLVAQGVQGGRSQAVVAAMVEGVSRGKTRKGKDFVRADFSDSSGQFSAACFEETLVEPMLRWAAEGTCVLLQVELDAPSPEEPPRVTVRGGRPLAEVTSAARMLLQFEVDRIEAMQQLPLMLQSSPQATGEVRARLRTASGGEPLICLGSNFQLDGELAERLGEIEGIANVALTAKRGGSHLRLVA
jgi:DNA polymerase III subunit alpha